MILPLRLSLVILLVLLQFIAPLIHAHAGEKISSIGIHLPHFERYNNAELQANNNLPCKVAAFCNAVEGQIVGVHTGLSRSSALLPPRLLKKIADNHHSDYLSTYAFSPTFVTLPRVITARPFFILLEPVIYSSQSPRAPPFFQLS